METPSLIFYEHSFDDSIRTNAVKNAMNLGNECRAWHQQCVQLEAENARLKADVKRLSAFCTRTIIPNEVLRNEVERLNNLIISGGAVTEDAKIYS